MSLQTTSMGATASSGRRYWCSMSRVTWIVGGALLGSGLVGGCGSADEDGSQGRSERVPPEVQARLPNSLGALWDLCPAPDIPQRLYDERSRQVRRATRALIGEVRRRPDALVKFTSRDSESARAYHEEMTVRELAEEHLRTPGVAGVPCERALMTELQDAVDGGKNPRRPAPDTVVFTWDEVIDALRLRKRSTAYKSPAGCEVRYVLTDREELESERGEDLRGWVVITDPQDIVGVSVFRPSAPCRQEMARGLTRLAASK